MTLKGWNAKIMSSIGGVLVEVGQAQSLTIDINENLERYYAIGNRQAESIVEGNQEISGTLERTWVDNKLLGQISTSGSAQTEFYIYAYADKNAGTPSIFLFNCKADSESIDITQDDFHSVSMDFIAKSLTLV